MASSQNAKYSVIDSNNTLLASGDEDYMNGEQLAFFKQLLLELHETTSVRIAEAKKQMTRSCDSSDEADLAAWEEQSAIALRIADREQKLLPKIHQALERIRNEEFGYCLETGEEIGLRRLLARPTAEYCTEVKAIKELKENHYRG